MAAQGEVIKSFLVGLGFDVDESSLAVFNKSIKDAALRVTALYGTINAFAGSMVYAFSKISESFEEMGYQYHIIAPAINKAIVLRNELMKAYSAAGVNIRKVVVDSVRLNLSLAKTKFALEAIYKSVGSKFFGLLEKQSDAFRKKLYQNMPYIQNALEHLVKGVFKAFEAVTVLGQRLWGILSRVYDFFVALDKATDGWSTIVLGLVAAWKFLNLSFLATPLGLVFALGALVLGLYDDFMTAVEGGESLIDWGSDFTKMIVGLVAGVGALAAGFYAWSFATKAVSAATALFNGVLGITDALLLVLEAPVWLIVAAIGALIAALTLADEKWKIFGGHLSGFFTGVGGKILDFVAGAPNLTASLSNVGSAGGAPPSALGSNPGSSNSVTNINAKHQTDITVQGSPNPEATARAVGNGMKQNYDSIDYLNGRTR